MHVVTVTSRGQLMVSAMQGARPCCDLSSLASAPLQSPDAAATVRWRELLPSRTPREGEGEAQGRVQAESSHPAAAAEPPALITYHAVLDDRQQQQQQQGGRSAVQAGVLQAISCILDDTNGLDKLQRPPQKQTEQQQQQQQGPWQQQEVCWVVLDADDSQLDASFAAQPTASSPSPTAAPASATLARAAVQPTGASHNLTATPASTGAAPASTPSASTPVPADSAFPGSTRASLGADISLFEGIVARWGRRCIALVQVGLVYGMV